MSSPRGKRKASSAKGKKKSEKKAPTTTDLEATDKLVKAGVEIEVLLRELEHNNELKDRLASRNGEQKGRIERLEDQLENRNVDRAEITSDMSRQYKSMQAEMMARISALESINADLKQKLSLAQQSLQDTAREYERKLAAREEVIDDQNVKIAQMSAEFESMLNVRNIDEDDKETRRRFPQVEGERRRAFVGGYLKALVGFPLVEVDEQGGFIEALHLHVTRRAVPYTSNVATRDQKERVVMNDSQIAVVENGHVGTAANAPHPKSKLADLMSDPKLQAKGRKDGTAED
ncbi:hypothetical protein HK101_008019 [Irineochytrium annulatum]|nr:hypothetical protein HK101_008019 [Irineochytrium annulatum]